MAHYAFLDDNNIVTEVIVGKDEYDLDTLPEDFISWEDWYGNFKNQVCKRTSYNTMANIHILGETPFRGNYAGVGFVYDEINDVFYPPSPFNSWVISVDTNWVWQPPIEIPELTQEEIDNNNYYEWDEDLYQSDNSLGWVLVTE